MAPNSWSNCNLECWFSWREENRRTQMSHEGGRRALSPSGIEISFIAQSWQSFIKRLYEWEKRRETVERRIADICGDITILCCSNLRMFSRCHRNYCWCGGWISCRTSCCCWNSCFFRMEVKKAS